jgi:hypothetical protein
MKIFAKIVQTFFCENHHSFCFAKNFARIIPVIHFWKKSLLKLCGRSLLSYTYRISRKLKLGNKYFLENFRKTNIFAKVFEKICLENLMSSKSFHKNGPCVSQVVKFAFWLFCDNFNFKEKSFVYL